VPFIIPSFSWRLTGSRKRRFEDPTFTTLEAVGQRSSNTANVKGIGSALVVDPHADSRYYS
jgi:hypothetical protein